MFMAGLSAGLREGHLRMLRAAMAHPEGLLTPLTTMTPADHERYAREIVALGHAEFVSGVSFREEDVWYMADSARLLRITDLGVAAIAEQDRPRSSIASAPAPRVEDTPIEPTPSAVTASATPKETETSAPSPGMKAKVAERVMALLRRPEGALIEDIVAECGWRKHTARGFLSRLRAQGYAMTITPEQAAGGGKPRMRYRLS